MTLVEFLLARIAEDEATARAAVIPAHDGPGAYKPHPELRSWTYSPYSQVHSGEVEYEQTPEMLSHEYVDRFYVTCDGEGLSPSVDESVGPHIARHDPARVLAECEAKRRIVADHSDHYSPDDPAVCDAHDGKYGVDECPTLRALAGIYANHPDYRVEWRP
ncbi:MAG: DUF6221 family protein [Mycobacteriaceae bacterium]